MRHPVLRFDWELPKTERGLFLAYVLLQELVVLGLTTPSYPDSDAYLHLSLTGRAFRLPTVPLLYKIVPGESTRIAAQVILAAAAWWILARVAGELLEDRRVRIGLRAVLLTIGLIGPVSSWNSIILSESVAISLTALLVACWLRFATRKNWRNSALALLVTLLWTLTRQPNVLFGVGITILGIAALMRAQGGERLRAFTALGLTLVTCVGLAELSRNQTLSKNNLTSILQMRVLPNDNWRQWFVEREGMPYDAAIARYTGVPRQQSESVPRFYEWIDDKGVRAYVHFILSHPRYTLTGTLPYLSGETASVNHPGKVNVLHPNPTPSILTPSVNYGRHRELVPSVVKQLLWDSGQIGDVVALALAALGCAILSVRRFGGDSRFLVPSIAVALVVPEAYVLWLSGGETTAELDRLSMVTAVSLRIGLWIMLAIALDRFAAPRGRWPRDSAVRRRSSSRDA